MKRTLFITIFISTLLALSFTSCLNDSYRPEQQERADIEIKLDSLTSAGKHGFFVATYIIGRLKKVLIDQMPVNIEVLSVNQMLLERPIEFKILDSANYQLTSIIDLETTIIRGTFEKPLQIDNFKIVISKKDLFKETSDPAIVESLTGIDYEFKIFKY